MLLSNIKTNNQVNFKSIDLIETEKQKSDALLQKLITTPEQEADSVKFQLYELYDKHLQKEIEAKTKWYHLKEDFAQEMFLKFFEVLEDIRKNIIPKENIISILNNIKPSQQEEKLGIRVCSIYTDIGNTNDTWKDFFTSEDLPVCTSETQKEKLTLMTEQFDDLIKNSYLKDIENNILNEKRKGNTVENIATKFGISPSLANFYYYRAIIKIQHNGEILPKNLE